MTCMKQEFCIHEKYCQRHIGQNFDSCILFSRNSKPITNEEWLHTLNTEEKAFALETIIRSVLILRSPMCHDVCNREFWERWLKEKHNDNT